MKFNLLLQLTVDPLLEGGGRSYIEAQSSYSQAHCKGVALLKLHSLLRVVGIATL